jgi:hypothetical protein
LLCVFFVVIAYYSVFFLFSLGGGRSVQGAMLIWPRIVCATYTLWSVSSQAVWALLSGGGTGALLVSPFNVKWRCYAQARSVEESQFCLFSVIFPVRCISSISPRFYFRRHAFCFLPLTTILESPAYFFTLFLFWPLPPAHWSSTRSLWDLKPERWVLNPEIPLGADGVWACTCLTGKRAKQIFAPECVVTTNPSPKLAETPSLGRCLSSGSLQALKRLKNAFSVDSRGVPMGKENWYTQPAWPLHL